VAPASTAERWGNAQAFVQAAIIALAMGGMVFLVLVILIAPDQTYRMLSSLGLVVLAIASWLMVREGRVQSAINLLGVGFWLTITATAIYHGGVNTPVVYAYPLVIFIAGWLMSVRAALCFAMLSSLAVGVFAWAQSSAILPVPPSTHPALHASVQIAVCLLTAGLIVSLVRFHARQLAELNRVRDDLAERSISLEARGAELQRAQAVAKIGSWIYSFADDTLRFSVEACRIFNLPPGTTFSHDGYLASVHREDRDRVEAQWSCALQGAVFDSEHRIVQGSNMRWVRLKAEVLMDALGRPLLAEGVSQDISERKKSDALIHDLAFFDPLTQLPNRRLLADRLQQALHVCARNRTWGALFFIDLDQFKTLNDIRGHDQGDLLLKTVATRLCDSVRAGDTVARLGGDEFVVVLLNLQGDEEQAASQSELIGNKILAVLRQPYPLGENEHRCTASIGIALFNAQSSSVDELLKQADLAMYHSKDAGRNTLHFFDPSMSANAVTRAALEFDLRHAVEKENGQLALHFQPQVQADGSVVSVEALLRWAHPTRGSIPPMEFIPIAEDSGLIIPLGNWVLERACLHLRDWADVPHLAQVSIAINVSAHQFREERFVDLVAQALQRAGVQPHRLTLELTESVLVSDVAGTVDKMRALNQLGVRCALDDFGTGYSSLAYLKQLPIHLLKIDRTFVREILTNQSDVAIARAVIALASGLGLPAMAEGVETAAQHGLLADLGCSAFQGYWFSPPVAQVHLDAWMAERSSVAVQRA
jgi:diguanylate cyclase (GGDEF)-like protein